MSKFEKGTRVVVVGENNDIKKGTVKSVCEAIKMAVVDFDNGETGKVHFSSMGIESEDKVQGEKKNEPVEKSEITITPEEFRNISSDVIADHMTKIGSNGILVGMVLTVIVADIHKRLFFDGVDNE